MGKLQRENRTIKKEMLFLSFLFLLLVSVLFGVIFNGLLYERDIKSAKNSLRLCNSQIVTYTEGMFHENASLISLLAKNESIITAGSDKTSDVLKIFEDIRNNNRNITYIYAGYANGTLLIDNYEAPAKYNPMQRPWYAAAVNTDGVARVVYRDAATNEWLFNQSKKLIDENGNLIGVVCIDCSNENITEQLSTKYQYSSQRSYIVNLEGVVLIHPDETKINDLLTYNIQPNIWNDIVSGKSNYTEYYEKGIRAFAYFEKIPETDFIVVTAINASEVIRPVLKSIMSIVLIVIAISIPLGILLTSILIRRFAAPIIELRDRIHAIALGNEVSSRDIRFYNEEINGMAQNIEIIVKDIANREELRKNAEYQSFHDSMTGLYNRRFFEEELKRLDVIRNYPLCIVCCDVNGLKLVNDIFGHAVGDKLLITVADSLKKGCRTDDILARIGGDEFTIILPNTSSGDAKKLILRMKDEFLNEKIAGAKISVAMGYAIKTGSDQKLEDILKGADEMMYQQKTTESVAMKQMIVATMIESAEKEKIIKNLSKEELYLLENMTEQFCDTKDLSIQESYRLRNIGLCTMLALSEYGQINKYKCHTKTAYRILSLINEYHNVAENILCSTEHWDGSGFPDGRKEAAIPMTARIIAIVAAYTKDGIEKIKQNSSWYEPKLIEYMQEYDKKYH